MHEFCLTLTDGLVHATLGYALGTVSGRVFALWLRKRLKRGSD